MHAHTVGCFETFLIHFFLCPVIILPIPTFCAQDIKIRSLLKNMSSKEEKRAFTRDFIDVYLQRAQGATSSSSSSSAAGQ